MRLITAVLVAGLPVAAGAETVYKWLDAKGIVTYGRERPAAGGTPVRARGSKGTARARGCARRPAGSGAEAPRHVF
jgi:hypothetical protein